MKEELKTINKKIGISKEAQVANLRQSGGIEDTWYGHELQVRASRRQRLK